MPASRRLAAILAADIAGYSRLMEADEEGVTRVDPVAAIDDFASGEAVSRDLSL
jgi:class 3 adenylate cyclase